MKKIYFPNVKINDTQTEDLYFNYSIVELDFPILFTLSTESNGLPKYIALCSEIADKQLWIISETCINDIKELLTGKKYIYDMFLYGNTKKIQVIYTKKDGLKYSYVDLNDIDEYNLPEKNEFLEIDEDEHIEYLNLIKSKYVSYNKITNINIPSYEKNNLDLSKPIQFKPFSSKLLVIVWDSQNTRNVVTKKEDFKLMKKSSEWKYQFERVCV